MNEQDKSEQDRRADGTVAQDSFDAIEAIAIVGMAGRFPQAVDLDAFWRNLRDGVESVSFFSDEELLEAGADPDLVANPKVVKARAVLEDPELFDAAFFDLSPLEASLLDPQHRIFLELSHKALEDAGYDPERYREPVGVFGGVSQSTYFFHCLAANPDLLRSAGGYQVALGTEKDYLTTRVSYKLDLSGPSADVQAACSTSMVAVHLACQSLLTYQCEMALAGGVSVKFPQQAGYVYSEGGLDSSDGHCRAFDARGDGSVYGSGAGVVALKRLEDALEAGDHVHAVILSSAMTNDGAGKVGYTAPSIGGQAKAIALAHALAGVPAESISYVEAHGTGTRLGDPIEVAALTKAFGRTTEKKGFCALGSVKTNIGHLSAAAGAAGLIKTVLALRHKQIPPSLHFEEANPEIDFAASPVFVNHRLRDWEAPDGPRRAGVSSFGLGGTNVHAVLEEAPETEPSGPAAGEQLVVVSAKTEAALEKATDELAAFLAELPAASFADAAFTALVGRTRHPYRRAVVARSAAEAAEKLRARDPLTVLSAHEESKGRPVSFLFAGVGDHYPGMARGLYESQPVFRQELDRCLELLRPSLGEGLGEALFASGESGGGSGANGSGLDMRRMLGRGGGHGPPRALDETRRAQPLTFAVEYALARQWMHWGVAPQAVIGYSLGEYAAATVAGVLTLEEALFLVAERAKLIQALPAGAMLAVPVDEEEARALLGEELSLAAVNGPGLSVVAGPPEAIDELAARLEAEGRAGRRLPTTHAFHSRMMEPLAAPLTELCRQVELAAPRIAYLSNLTGDWIGPEEAGDPGYWTRHLLGTVRFGDGLSKLLERPGALVEIGPGQGLGSLVVQASSGLAEPPVVVPSLPSGYDRQPDESLLLGSLARLWLAGVRIDWERFYAGQRRRRIPLPTYPFERKRFWVEPRPGAGPWARPAPAAAGVPPGEAAASESASRPEPSPAFARHERPNLRSPYAAARSELEGALVELWQGLLGIERVGVFDNFFELGGHSLLGTQVLSRLRDRLGVELPLSALFEGPTVAELAGRLEGAGAGASPPPEIVPVPRDGALPLSFGQERLWFLHRMQPGNPFYNLPTALEVHGSLVPQALEAGLAGVIARHETLRTSFHAVDGEPVQRIAPRAGCEVPVVDLGGLDTEAREAEASRLAEVEARGAFDLGRAPLLRLRALRLGGDQHLLLLTVHHIVSDGWSTGILVPELIKLYTHALEGGEPPFEPLPVHYADYAAWQRGLLQGERLERLLGFWRRALADLPTLELPTDRPRPALQSFRGATWRRSLGAELTEAAGELARARGTTPFSVLLGAFLALLARLSGRTDVVVGSPVANRTASVTEGMVGLFINTLVLRTRLGRDPRFTEVAEAVREMAGGAFGHQELPFERLVEALQPPRDLSRNPLFQVMFNLLNLPAERVEVGGLSVERVHPEMGTTLFDLTLLLGQSEEGLEGAWEYNADLFDPATVERMGERYRRLLQAVVENPEVRLSELPLLSEAETEQIVHGFNSTEAEFSRERTLPELVAAQAARTPDAVALGGGAPAGGGETWTYAELAARSAALAGRLRAAGAGPEALVGVVLERGPGLVAGLLAIARAGGAWVPLDPAYPAERLAFMVEDSGLSVLLADHSLTPGLAAALPLDGVIRVAPDWSAAEAADAAEAAEGGAVAMGAKPENLAYVLYTSGSTGRPKGVAVPHRALVNFLEAMGSEVDLEAGGALLAVTSLSFDIAALELFGPLLAGGRVEIASAEEAADGPRLLERLAASGAAAMQATPATWRLLLESGWKGSETPGLVVLCGGEALPPSLAETLIERAGAAGSGLWNLYGPTETTVWSAAAKLGPGDAVSLGTPLANTAIHVLDRWGRPAPCGVAGEISIGGEGLARGYLGRPGLTAERFVPDPLASDAGEAGGRLYRTGDLGRRLEGGRLDFLGRLDHQVKLRGHRIELGEVEAALAALPEIGQAVAAVRDAEDAERARLVAYLVPAAGVSLPADSALRERLRERLPDSMLPAAFVELSALPLTPNGKVDRKALPAPERRRADAAAATPRTELERLLAETWREALGVEEVGLHDSFFDLGGHSLLLLRVQGRLGETLGRRVPVVDLFRYPTIASLAEHLGRDGAELPEALRGRQRAAARKDAAKRRQTDVAIVAMTGRFPGAAGLEEFWKNLRGGVESISFFSEEELAAAGVDAASLADPAYVRARGLLEGADLFDAEALGFSPREAELTDPQQRLFLECAWEALERAGHDPQSYPGAIGVFAGVAMNRYWFNVVSNPAVVASAGELGVLLGNDKDFLPTRTSYKLGLKGPSVNVQTACSTSLVAVHLACQSLLDGECDMALAGGSAINTYDRSGYRYTEDGIVSPDGHCRAFDARAQGTVGGAGVGVVVLKKLADALADGDPIHAVIKGSAINNDGSEKVGFTAPSVEGQAAVLSEALGLAGVDPASIGYVETHGTGTALGDPIEVAALTEAYGGEPGETCALGSVKTNVGHLDIAAGAAGLIKAALSVEHGEIPPSLHFESPNPEIDFASGPFYVNAALSPWPLESGPRRAGVSSFGLGGTNAHMVLEEAPAREPSGPSRSHQLLVLSAATEGALETASENLAAHLRAHPDLPLADVAHTLQVGRRRLRHRRALVAATVAEAASILEGRDPHRQLRGSEERRRRPVAFLLPGQGAQHPGMCAELYAAEILFRQHVDSACEVLRGPLGLDLRELLCTADPGPDAAERLRQTRLAQPALFAVEYALARLWMDWGMVPDALLGHSLGEYTAACLAGVVGVEDALRLVAERGRLMQEMEPGAMIAVPRPWEEVEARLPEGWGLAAVNAPGTCVVSGPEDSAEALLRELAAPDRECRRLHTSHAFHSRSMEPIIEPFRRAVAAVELRPPSIPFLSNVSGTWIRDQEATDPDYWARHLRRPVRFADGVGELAGGDRVLLEVGPGKALATAARRQLGAGSAVFTSLPDHREERSATEAMLESLGRLWLAGAAVDWPGFTRPERRRRLVLPTYPFERQRYWIEPGAGLAAPAPARDLGDWFYAPFWKPAASVPPARSAVPPEGAEQAEGLGETWWLTFLPEMSGLPEASGGAEAEAESFAGRLLARLEARGIRLFRVRPGDEFARTGDAEATLDPRRSEGFEALALALAEEGRMPAKVLHLSCLTPEEAAPAADGALEAAEESLQRGFFTLYRLAQALGARELPAPLEILTVTDRMQEVMPGEETVPVKATLLGPCYVLPLEIDGLTCRSIDVAPAADGGEESLLAQLEAELLLEDPGAGDQVVAYRGGRRWRPDLEPVRLPEPPPEPAVLRQGGVYLITGGLGGLGLAFAEHLAREAGAKLVLTGRSALPPREEWETWKLEHGGDDATSRRLVAVEKLEELGAEVLAVGADVTDREAMAAVLAEAEGRFGALNGVIHAAGLPGVGLTVVKSAETAAEVLAPKVRGTLVLDELLAGKLLDFFTMTSSISGLVGNLGQVDYCAANAFLDAFARRRTARGAGLTVAAGWDTWRDVGMAVNVEVSQEVAERREVLLRAAIEPAAGCEALLRLLGAGLPHLVVSSRDFRAVVAQSREMASAGRAERRGRGAQAPGERPQLATEYAAPSTETEEKIASIWGELLGISGIGVHDSFFDLGGDSLVGIQVVSRLRASSLGANISLRNLFDAPTVAQLAAVLETGAADQQEEYDALEDILAEIEGLTGDDLEAELAGAGERGGGG